MTKCIKHTCKDCIHFKICNDYEYLIGRQDKVACPDFKSIEDVVPRSEVEQLRKSVDDALKLLGIESKKVEKLQKQLAPFREKQCFTCKYLETGHDHMPCYRCKDYNEYVWLSADVERKYIGENKNEM